MEGTAFLLGIFVATVVYALLIHIFVPSVKQQWFDNICTYHHGQVQGEVCIVDGHTIDVPEYPSK
jgi:hypothetical protein